MSSKSPSPETKSMHSHLDTNLTFEEIPRDLIIEHDLTKFRPIAQRTIGSLLRRRAYTRNFALYNYEINKLILHELRRDETE